MKKTLILKSLNKYKWSELGILLGGIAGYFYWKEVGCITGTCVIQSNWEMMIPYGMLTGYFMADFVQLAVAKFGYKKCNQKI